MLDIGNCDWIFVNWYIIGKGDVEILRKNEEENG